jgi:L-amino acid N-acyltransferase YncA
MRTRPIVVHREKRFSLEIEDGTGRHCVSFPVFNGLVEYAEYYEVDAATFDQFLVDVDTAEAFVERCRNREMDHLLMEQPGRLRGWAC